jgi:DNA-binding MarR family transcriptional regulator
MNTHSSNTDTPLNTFIHQPTRLRVMAALTALEPGASVDFIYLRNRLKLTDGNLGAHLKRLEDANYVDIAKTFDKGKPRTYISATPKGRHALENHATILDEMLNGSWSGIQPRFQSSCTRPER